MTDAAVERQAGNARGRDYAARNREPEELGLPVAVTPGGASLRAHRLGRRVDVNATHLREVDDHAAVVDCVARHVVAAALDRQQQVLLAREVDGINDVRGPGASYDTRGTTFDEPVPDRAGIVVPLIACPQDRSPNTCHESLNRFRVEHHLSSQLACHRFLLCVETANDSPRCELRVATPPVRRTPRWSQRGAWRGC